MYLHTLWHTADTMGTQSAAFTSNVNEAFQTVTLTARLERYTCVIFRVARSVYFCTSGYRTHEHTVYTPTHPFCLIIWHSWKHFISTIGHLIITPPLHQPPPPAVGPRLGDSFSVTSSSQSRDREVKGQTLQLTADIIQKTTNRTSEQWDMGSIEVYFMVWGRRHF